MKIDSINQIQKGGIFMKKLLSLLLAAMLCLNLAVVSAAAESETSSFEKLNKYADVVEDWFGRSVSILSKNVSFTSTFTMESDEFLVIPKGKTLRLKGGAEIKGNIYIENGGKLIFEGGRTFIDGTIVSDGTMIRHMNTAVIYVNGALYVSPQGKLTEKDYGGAMAFEAGDTTARSQTGSIVCLGKTNSKSKDVAAKPVAAVMGIRHYISGELEECEVFADSIEKLYPDPEKYFREEEYPNGGSRQTLSVLFNNGSVLYAERPYSNEDGANYDQIFGLDIHLAMVALGKVRTDDSKE